MTGKTKRFYFIFILLAALLTSYSSALAGEGFRDVEVKEAVEIVAKEKANADFIILDVRTKSEYNDGHLTASRNIDIKSAAFREEIGKLDKGKTYLVYCRSGKRSKMAQEIMKELGFKNVLNMKEGFIGWADGENSYER